MILADHRTYVLPRPGARPEETEDAAAGPRHRGDTVRAALADGATESAYARTWALTLAEAAAEAPLAEALCAARARFARRTAPDALRPRPWYAEAKAAQGAHAALLAVALHADRSWHAEAVGDVVLFHLRARTLLQAWPLADPAAFSHRPALVASREDAPPPVPLTASGTWRPGDRLLLATDALAAFLLAHDPAAAAGLDAPAFVGFVEAARARGLRPDDVALIDLLLA